MPAYTCSSCGTRLDFEDLSDATVTKDCPACKGPKAFRKVTESEGAASEADPEAGKKKAAALLKVLTDYNGGECKDYDPVEEMIYNAMATAVAEVIDDKGKVDCATTRRDLAYIQGLVHASDQGGTLRATLLKGVVSCLEYKIDSASDFISFVRMMGRDAAAEAPCRLLHLFDTHRVLLTAGDHYCYPLELNGETVDLRHYRHEYDKLMEWEGTAEDQLAFLKEGTCWTAEVLSVNVANLICESDRNWNQLFLSLVLLKKKKIPTCMAKRQLIFPMAGGGWKNHGSWGPGANPTGVGGGATNDIKRWMVKVLIVRMVGSDGSTLLEKLCSGSATEVESGLTALKKAIKAWFNSVIDGLG